MLSLKSVINQFFFPFLLAPWIFSFFLLLLPQPLLRLIRTKTSVWCFRLTQSSWSFLPLSLNPYHLTPFWARTLKPILILSPYKTPNFRSILTNPSKLDPNLDKNSTQVLNTKIPYLFPQNWNTCKTSIISLRWFKLNLHLPFSKP